MPDGRGYADAIAAVFRGKGNLTKVNLRKIDQSMIFRPAPALDHAGSGIWEETSWL
jgi:hypothetical protein